MEHHDLPVDPLALRFQVPEGTPQGRRSPGSPRRLRGAALRGRDRSDRRLLGPKLGGWSLTTSPGGTSLATQGHCCPFLRFGKSADVSPSLSRGPLGVYTLGRSCWQDGGRSGGPALPRLLGSLQGPGGTGGDAIVNRSREPRPG